MAVLSALVALTACGDTTPAGTGDAGADSSSPDSTVMPEGSADAGGDGISATDVVSDAVDADAGAPNDAGDGSADAAASGDSSADAPASDDATADAPADGVDAGPACAVYDASGLDDAAVQAGYAAVLNSFKCHTCHQSDRSTDDAGNPIIVLNGNFSGSSGAYAPNLTNSPQALGCWTNDEIQTATLYATDPQGRALCPPMPAWSQQGMSVATARNIAVFLRSLPPSANVVPDNTCPSASDAAVNDAPSD